MSEKDNLFGKFKESSETERAYTPSAASWSKINSNIAADLYSRWKRMLFIIPWFFIPLLFFSNGYLFFKQKETNESLQELKNKYSVQSHHHHDVIEKDTIYKVRNTYVYDTVYIHQEPRHIYKSSQQLSQQSENVSKENRPNNQPASQLPTAGVRRVEVENDIDTKSLKKEVTLTPTKTNIGSDLEKEVELVENKKSSAGIVEELKEMNSDSETAILIEKQGSISADQSIAVLSKSVNKEEVDEIFSDTLTDTTPVLSVDKQIKSNSESQEEKSKTEVSTTQLKKEKKDKVPLGEKLKKLDTELGFQLGIAIPDKFEGVDQKAYYAGAVFNVNVSDRFQIWTNATYSILRVRTNKVGQIAWLPVENQSDSNFTLESTRAVMQFYQFSAGFRYFITSSKKLTPFLDFGYGGHYVQQHKAIYEFEDVQKSQDLIIERDLNYSRFNLNDVILGAGIQYNPNDKMKTYLLGKYQFNREETLFKHPDYIGLSLLLVW